MISQHLTVPVHGAAMPAYLARPPESSGPHPAVIVLQEIFGVNAEIQRVTDLVASIGYVGLAINYYHRTHPDLNESYDEAGMARGYEAARNISKATLRADVGAARDWLAQQNFVKDSKVATWGFCMGGTAAFITATLPGLRGAIAFYGGAIAGRGLPNGEPEALVDAADVRCPLLLCFGAEDPGIPAMEIERIGRTLTALHKDHQIVIYPNVGHAFFRHGSPAAVADTKRFSDEAVAEAVADSWGLVQAFLKRVFA